MRKVSPAMFVLIVLCFFLPFVTLSCEGQKMGTLNGVNLVTGTTMQVDTGFSKESQKVDAVGGVAFALIVAIGGAALYFLRHKFQPVAGAVLGVVGAISLMTAKSGMADKLARDKVTVETEFGYTFVLLLFFAAALWNLYLTVLAPDAPFRIGAMQPALPVPKPSEHEGASDQRQQ